MQFSMSRGSQSALQWPLLHSSTPIETASTNQDRALAGRIDLPVPRGITYAITVNSRGEQQC